MITETKTCLKKMYDQFCMFHVCSLGTLLQQHHGFVSHIPRNMFEV